MAWISFGGLRHHRYPAIPHTHQCRSGTLAELVNGNSRVKAAFLVLTAVAVAIVAACAGIVPDSVLITDQKSRSSAPSRPRGVLDSTAGRPAGRAQPGSSQRGLKRKRRERRACTDTERTP